MVNMKTVMKYAGAACVATGIVALSGLVASGAAVGAVVEGFKSAADTIKKLLSDTPRTGEDVAEEEKLAEETTDVESDTENQTLQEN